jgi:hypothetical protein
VRHARREVNVASGVNGFAARSDFSPGPKFNAPL